MVGSISFIVGFILGFVIISCVMNSHDADHSIDSRENYVAYKIRVERRLQQIRDGSPARYWVTIDEMEKILEEENGRME